MPNDLSTLSGALLEMKDQLIYELGQKGVTAQYDPTTGLLGLIGEISNIQQGGSSYHIEFTEDSYIATGGTATVSIYLQSDYQPLANATVTFTSSTSTTTTATTDTNGIATATISFSDSTTLTATYQNVSDTATITYSTYLFYDSCTTDNVSQYSTRGRMGSSATTVTMSFSSATNGYNVYGSGGDYFGWFAIPNIRGLDNLKISCQFYLRSSSAYNQVFIGCTDTLTVNSSSSFTADFFRVRADKQVDYIHNSGSEKWKKTNAMTFQNNWARIEFIKQGTSISGNVYNANGDNVATMPVQTGNTYTNPYFFIGINTRYTSDTKYIKEIKVESL